MLINEHVVTKYNYLRMYWMQQLKNQIDSFVLDMDKIFYFREGSTVCHDFALNPERLAEVFELFQEEDPELYSMLLMPDKNGNTPVDIALDNQSPKCLELMLAKIATLTQIKASRVFADRFGELFDMDLASFQTFLDSCFF